MNNTEREEWCDAALELMVRAYHALAVLYEIRNPNEYGYFDRHILPYLAETPLADGIYDAEGATRAARAVDRVRAILTDVGTDVAAIRPQVLNKR